MIIDVPLTLKQIVQEACQCPPEKMGELVDRLAEQLPTAEPALDESWKQAARRRLAEIESGQGQAVRR